MAQHSLVRVRISNSVVLCGRNGTRKSSVHRFQNIFSALRLVIYKAFSLERLFHVPNPDSLLRNIYNGTPSSNDGNSGTEICGSTCTYRCGLASVGLMHRLSGLVTSQLHQSFTGTGTGYCPSTFQRSSALNFGSKFPECLKKSLHDPPTQVTKYTSCVTPNTRAVSVMRTYWVSRPRHHGSPWPSELCRDRHALPLT